MSWEDWIKKDKKDREEEEKIQAVTTDKVRNNILDSLNPTFTQFKNAKLPKIELPKVEALSSSPKQKQALSGYEEDSNVFGSPIKNSNDELANWKEREKLVKDNYVSNISDPELQLGKANISLPKLDFGSNKNSKFMDKIKELENSKEVIGNKKSEDKYSNLLQASGEDLMAFATKGLQMAHKPLTKVTEKIMGRDNYKSEDDFIQNALDSSAKSLKAHADSLDPTDENTPMVERLMNMAGRTLPAMLLTGQMGGALGNLSKVKELGKFEEAIKMIPFLANSFGQGSMEAEEKGGDYATQLKKGLITAGVEGATESNFMPSWFNKLLDGGLDEVEAKTIKEALKEFGKDILKEGGQEAIGDPVNNLGDKFLFENERDKKLFGQGGVVDPRQMGEDFLGGAMIGGLGGVPNTMGNIQNIRAKEQLNPLQADEKVDPAPQDLTPDDMVSIEDMLNQSKNEVPKMEAEQIDPSSPTADIEGLGTVEIIESNPEGVVIQGPNGQAFPIRSAIFNNVAQLNPPMEQPTIPTTASKLNAEGINVLPSNDNVIELPAPKNDIVETPDMKPEEAESNVKSVPLKDINVDPERFQFKSNTDSEGVTNQFKNGEKFNKNMAGIITLWKDNNNKLWVVNGHHRVEFANRSGVDSLNAQILDEKDGWEEKDVRTLGAKINIADGKGTAIDSAKIFRENNMSLEDLKNEGMSLSENKVKTGFFLSKLESNVFNKVVNGELTESKGAIIGEHFPNDSVNQNAVMKVLNEYTAKGKNISDSVFKEIIDMAKASETTKTEQFTLFGTEEIAKSNMVERGEVISGIKQLLNKEKKLFENLSNNKKAEIIKKAGNVLVDDKNLENKNISELAIKIVEGFKNSKGTPIAEVISNYTKAYSEGTMSRQEAIAKAYVEIKSLIKGGKYLGENNGGNIKTSTEVSADRPLPEGKGQEEIKHTRSEKIEAEEQAGATKSSQKNNKENKNQVKSTNKNSQNVNKEGKKYEKEKSKEELKKQTKEALSDLKATEKGNNISDTGRKNIYVKGVKGLAISPQLINTGKVDFVGQVIDSPEKLATISQVYRDPRFETFRIFYMKGDTIVGHEGVSSKVPNMVVLNDGTALGKGRFYNHFKNRMSSMGADGYYILHNHPSGNPEPSGADFNTTREFNGRIDGFKGHIIIDSNKFAHLYDDGLSIEHEVKDLNLGEDKLLKPSIEHPLLNKVITSATSFSEMAKTMEMDKSMHTIVYVTAKNGVRAIQEVPDITFSKYDLAVKYLTNRMKEFGAVHVFVVAGQNTMNNPNLKKLIENGIALDVYSNLLDRNLRSLGTAPKSNIDESSWNGEKAKPYKVMEKQEAYINNPNFKEWFEGSKVVDENGKPLAVYSGHGNMELYGDKYNPKLATAGAFYTTTDPDIASNYAKDKLGVKENYENGSEFRFYDEAKGKYSNKIEDMKLTAEQVEKADEFMQDLGYDMTKYIRENAKYDKEIKRLYYMGGIKNLSAIHGFLEQMGDTVRYTNQQSNFEDMLDHLGIKWTSFYQARGGVMKVYLNIKNPIDTSKPFPKDVMEALETVAKKEKKQSEEDINYNHWTRNYPVREWIKDIKKMEETGEETFWATQVPSKALKVLKEFGYDGIKDVGGKMGGDKHQVWLAFEPTQIKSATGNSGKFSSKNASIIKEHETDYKTNDNFKKWFEGSKVVDEEGQPLKVYHGTTKGFNEFDKNKIGYGNVLGNGFYFTTSSESADMYSQSKKEGSSIMPVYLDIKNPIDSRKHILTEAELKGLGIDSDLKDLTLQGIIDKKLSTFKTLREDLQKLGYDGIKEDGGELSKLLDSGETWIAFEPAQIKSAIGNNGEFDPNNPNILEEEKAGYNNNQETIYIGEGRNRFPVFKNPSDEEIWYLFDRFKEENPNAPKGEPKTRTTYDKQGNKYMWVSSDSMHYRVENYLKDTRGIEANQNKFFDDELKEDSQDYSSNADPIANEIRTIEQSIEKGNVPPELVQSVVQRMNELKRQQEEIKTGTKQRRHAETYQNSEFMHPEVKLQLAKKDTTYNPITNKETWEKALDYVYKHYDEAYHTIKSLDHLRNADDTARAEAILYKLQSEKRFIEASEWAVIVTERATNTAQALQALSIVGRLSPEGILRTAQRELNKGSTEGQRKTVNKKSKEAEEGFKNIIDSVIDDVGKKAEDFAKNKNIKGRKSNVKDTSSGDQNESAVDTETSPEEKIINGAVNKTIEELPPEERVAKKVENHMKEPKAKTVNPMEDMIRTLYEVAKENLPEKQKNLARNPMEFITQAIKNKAEYKDIWSKAQEIVKERFKDNPEALLSLQNYFGHLLEKPFAEKDLEKSIRVSLKELNINLGELVKEHYSKVNAVGKSLEEKLMDKGLDKKEAEELAGYIKEQFNKMTKKKKEQLLNRMFGSPKTKKQKMLHEKILEWSNLGAIDDTKFRSYVAEKLGIPSMNEELAKDLVERANFIQTMPEGEEKYIETALMLDRIAREIPPTKWEKINTTQTIFMLLNPKTYIRNALGNGIFGMVDRYLTYPVAKAVDLATRGIKRTGESTIALPSPAKYVGGLVDGTKKGVKYAKLGINPQFKENSRIELPRTTFRKETAKGLSKVFQMHRLETALRISLQATDDGFKQATIRESLSQQMKLKGVNEPTEAMVERAKKLAEYRTFQRNGSLASLFSGLKQLLNNPKYFMSGGKEGTKKAWGLGDVVLKFPKVPANLLDIGLDYSPIGVAKAFYHIYEDSKAHNGFNQFQFSMDISRAVTGTSIIALGYVLASLGLLSGRGDDDEDLRNIQEDTGFGQYRLNLSGLIRYVNTGSEEGASPQENDITVDYGWLQPNGLALAIGSDLAKSKKILGVDTAQSIVEAISSGANTIAEQPMLSGLRRMAQSRDVVQGLATGIKSVPSSFIPSLSNQFRQLEDNASRSTMGETWGQEAMNMAKSRVPIVSRSLLPRIDSLGHEKEVYQDKSNNLFNVFLNPSFTKKYKPSDEQQLVLDIFKESGNKIQVPRVAPKTITFQGESFKLTPQEYNDYQQFIGESAEYELSKISGVSLKPDEQAQKIKTTLDKINEKAKKEFLINRGINPNRKKPTK